MGMDKNTGSTPAANNNQRNAIIIVVVLVVIVGVFLLLNRPSTPEEVVEGTNVADRDAGDNQAGDDTFASEGITLGEFVAGSGLDRDSCVINETGSFDREDSIYVGLLNSQIPANTPVFVRLYANGQAVEDTEEVSSPEDFQGCLWFEFSASTGAEVLESGDYEAEIFVNTRPADTVSFSVN